MAACEDHRARPSPALAEGGGAECQGFVADEHQGFVADEHQGSVADAGEARGSAADDHVEASGKVSCVEVALDCEAGETCVLGR